MPHGQEANGEIESKVAEKDASMGANKSFDGCLGIKKSKSQSLWIYFKRVANALRLFFVVVDK